MSEPINHWLARGMELHFAHEPSAWDFVGFHNESLATVVADRHNADLADFRRALDTALAENDAWRQTGGDALRKYLQATEQINQLESQLGQAHAELARMETLLRSSGANHALDQALRTNRLTCVVGRRKRHEGEVT